MLHLIRHWLLPGCLRRLPWWARPILLAPIAVALSIELVPKYEKALHIDYSLINIGNYAGSWICTFAPCLVAVVSLIAGTVTVAVERQRMRLGEMLATRLTAGQVVNALLVVRFTQSTVFIVIPYLATAHQQGRLFGSPNFRDDNWALFEVLWGAVQICMRTITFTLIGMAISCAVRRVQTALAIAGSMVAAYAGVFVISEHFYYGAGFGSFYSYDEHFYSHLFYWPIREPYQFGTPFWDLDVLADGLLGLLLPITCYLLCRRLCGRRP